MQHGYDAVNTARGFPPKKAEEDEEDEEDEEQEAAADGPAIAAKPKTTAKTGVDVSQVEIVSSRSALLYQSILYRCTRDRYAGQFGQHAQTY